MRPDDDALPWRLVASGRRMVPQLGSGHHLVHAQALLLLLHVRYGKGFRTALPLRPVDASGLESVPADLALHGCSDRDRHQSLRSGVRRKKNGFFRTGREITPSQGIRRRFLPLHAPVFRAKSDVELPA